MHLPRTLSACLFRRNPALMAIIGIAVAFAGPALAQTQASEKPKTVLNDAYEMPVPMVVQNRFFRKAFRPEMSLSGGVVLNEAYSQTFGGSIRGGFYLSEYLGIELGYTKFASSASADLEALSKLVYYKKDQSPTHVVPSFVELKDSISGHVSFAPVYGKINLLDYAIVYSDIAVSAGIGMLKTSAGDEIPGILGIGQRFFFSKSWSLRVDAWDYIFSETRENNGQKLEGIRHAWFVSLGLGVFLWGGDR